MSAHERLHVSAAHRNAVPEHPTHVVVDMISHRVRGMMLVHSLLLGGAAALLFWAWMAAHFSLIRIEGTPDWMRYVVYCVVVVSGFGIDLLISKVRGTDLLQLDLPATLRLTFRQTLTILGTILLFLVASKDQAMSRLFLFSFVPLLYGMLLLLNRMLPVTLARFLFRAKRREKTLLVGSLDRTGQVLAWCRNKAHYGLDVVGLVTNDSCGSEGRLPVLGTIAELEEVIRKHGVTQIISLNLPNTINRIAKFGSLCDRFGVRLLAVNDLQERFHRPVTFFSDGGLRFISLREEPLECPFNRMVKRLVDVALALPIILFVLPPLSLAIFVIHRLQSPGPLFFRQKRTGMNSHSFWIYKFRTMHVNHGCESQQATKDDVRVFRVGRWLRKLSLDELPQFLNVIKGEMSIVGPRPHMVEHDDIFAKVASSYHVRTRVKPGITGLAQVRGFRGEAITDEDVVKRVESDVHYLENWSVSLEWAIILKTAWQLINPPRSAY